MTVFRLFIKNITVRTDINACISNYFLTNCVKWWVCNLCEKLLKVVEKRSLFISKWRNWYICTHSRNRLYAILSHRKNTCSDFFICVAKSLLKSYKLFIIKVDNILIRNLQILEVNEVVIKPFTIRLSMRIVVLNISIVNKLTLCCINKEHLTRTQTLFYKNLFRWNIYTANL